MKLKVKFTRRPRVSINNFNFFTEGDQNQENVDLGKNAKDAASENPEKAKNAFKDMMSRFGNSLTEMFNKLVEWIKGLPKLASKILEHLKGLWGKIKKWMTNLHIVNRAKSLSMVVVCCIGFIGAMVANWTYMLIYKEAGRPKGYAPNAANGVNFYKTGINAYLKRVKTGKSTFESEIPRTINERFIETAIFIETFGEILREDENGGVFMTTAKKVITASVDKVKVLYKACRNSTNNRLSGLINFLTTAVCGSNAVLTTP